MTRLVLTGTFDSKGLEYEFARKIIADRFPTCRVVLVDIGYIQDPDPNILVPDIKAEEVALKGGCDSIDTVRKGSRESGYRLMTKGLTAILKDMYEVGELHGVLGIGGTCGSSMITGAMRELPLGLPKVMVSTAASTPVSLGFYGLADLTVINCVTDICGGVNRFNSQIISNAAVAVASMSIAYWEVKNAASFGLETSGQDQQKVIGITMIGATMPCVKEAHELLKDLGYEVVVFSAVGPGGRLVEKLLSERKISGMLDITLMELTCEFFGGTLSAGPERLEQAALTGTPQVVCPGAVDIIALGGYDEVVQKFPERKLYRHNEHITAMRTSSDECNKIGKIIAEKLNKSIGPCTLYIPKRGLTFFSEKDGPLYDPEADEALFNSLKTHLNPNVVQIIEKDDDINSKAFTKAMVDTLHSLILNTTKLNKEQ